jgi:membrane-bound lytic murein transglycosylase D
MQKTLTSFSRRFILALLTCSLLIICNSTDNSNFIKFTSTNIKSTENSQPIANMNPVLSDKSASIWNIMSKDFKLDDKVQSVQVQTQMRKLLANQTKFIQILKAAGPYIYYIHQQTRARGLPAEIGLIPIIESEFNPNDHSTKGARGLWQLMAGTAHELGIKMKAGHDGRLSLVASTKAALAYFKDLGNEFNGNWYLAIAAYNCGQMRVESAERKTGSRNFWKLPLPTETKIYVPKLLAVTAIIKNPQKYGIQLPVIANKPYKKINSQLT